MKDISWEIIKLEGNANSLLQIGNYENALKLVKKYAKVFGVKQKYYKEAANILYIQSLFLMKFNKVIKKELSCIKNS